MPQLPLYSSHWNEITLKRGVNPAMTKYTTFLPPEDVSAVQKRYWRDRATRSAIEEKINAYFTPSEYSYDIDLFKDCVDTVIYDWLGLSDNSIPLDPFGKVWPQLNLSATSGYPLFKRKGDTREESFRSFAKCKRKLKHGWNIPVFPAAMGARAVVREIPANKPRLVWIYPMDITLLEAQFVLPLMRLCIDKPNFGWHFRWNDNGFGLSQFRQLANDGSALSFISTDYSSFDSSIPRAVLKTVFDSVGSLFQYVDKTEINQYTLVRNYFLDTPLHVYESVIQKKRGIPSGSYFTSIIGSIVNLSLQLYFARFLGHVNSLVRAIALGDDCLLKFSNRGGFYPKEYLQDVSAVAQTFGMTIHPDKSDVYDISLTRKGRITFLGLSLSLKTPHYLVDFDSVIARAVVPEKGDRTPFDTLLRLHGLVYSFGYDRKVYNKLTQFKDYIHNMYPEVTDYDFLPDRYDPETFRYFTYVLNASIDISIWPDYSVLHQMYFGYF